MVLFFEEINMFLCIFIRYIYDYEIDLGQDGGYIYLNKIYIIYYGFFFVGRMLFVLESVDLVVMVVVMYIKDKFVLRSFKN